MITGAVTADREAVIRMVVRGPAGQEQEVEAVVDTGFDGWFSLPPALIALLECRGGGEAVRSWRTAMRLCLTSTMVRWSGMRARAVLLWMKQARRRWSVWRYSTATS
jgi:predicted aspartyl protease